MMGVDYCIYRTFKTFNNFLCFVPNLLVIILMEMRMER